MSEAWARFVGTWNQLQDPRVIDHIWDASRWSFADYLAFMLGMGLVIGYAVRVLCALALVAWRILHNAWEAHQEWRRSVERREADIRRRQEELDRRRDGSRQCFRVADRQESPGR